LTLTTSYINIELTPSAFCNPLNNLIFYSFTYEK
jgi:hypothetical protein